MKKVLLFPVALLAALSLFAQPTLQNNVFPDIGDVVTTASGDTLNIEPGNAGANQTWDFTALQLLEGTTATQQVFISPVGTPYAAEFPNANIVAKINEDTAIYAYYQKEANQFSILGAASLDFLQKYTDPDALVKTPLAYNGSYTETFAYRLGAGTEAEFFTTGSHNVTYDGYGTVKTPLGTFTNATRLKLVSTQIDSAVVTGGIEFINQTESTTYDWLVANQPGPIVSITYSSGTSETRIPGFDTIFTETPITKSVNYTTTSTTSVFSAPTGLSGLSITAIGPNPAVDQLTLRFDAENSGQALRVLITDATGKEIENQSVTTVAGENIWSLPIDRLATGNYFLTVTDGRGVMTRAWVKQ